MANEHHEDNRTFYDRISHAYDFIADAGEHTARQTGEKALSLQAGEQVLELGFGTGNTVLEFAKSVGPSGRVFGIDISPGMLTVASDKVSEQGLADRVELQVSDARDLPYGDGSFDAVFASFTLELFPLEDIPKVLQESQRVLKPGGRVGFVSMATVKEGQKASELEKTYIWMHRNFPHIVDCQPIDLVGYVRDAGFAIDQEIEMQIWTMPVRAVIGKK